MRYVVARLRGSSAHEVESFDGNVEGFAQSHEYVIGPFATRRAAQTFAWFCDRASGALNLMSAAYKLAARGKVAIADAVTERLAPGQEG